jgi:nucleoside-diphosphate-sugar epimerase
MAEMLLAHMGKRKPIIPLPVLMCRILALVSRGVSVLTGLGPLLTWQTISGIIQNADLDNTEARKDLGFKPRGFSEGIKELKSLQGCLS